MNRSIINTFIILSFLIISNNVSSQVFSGFSAFKNIIEYEGQRYLMQDVYDISPDSVDVLEVDKLITEIDENEGFMFVLTAYKYNEKYGVVISSFNSVSFYNNAHEFTNVHLTGKEFKNLHNILSNISNNKMKDDKHYLKKFNEQITVDVYQTIGYPYLVLWVDNYSRHTFTTAKWKRGYDKWKKFTNE